MLNLNSHLARLEREGRPIRVGIVGAGQMGTGLVSQIARMKGMNVVAVADITIERASAAYTLAGIPADRIVGATSVAEADAAVKAGKVAAVGQAELLTGMTTVDAVVEATGVPEVGAKIAELAIEGGKHTVMLNAETDTTIGFILRDMAAKKGVVYTGSAGDEPGAAKELYDFADGLGFKVLVAGKGKNNPVNKAATPADLAAEAQAKGASAKMLTSFVDGTKTMVEMTQLGNAIGFVPDCIGMHGPEADVKGTVDKMRTIEEGGILSKYGVVEYINGIAPGVFVIVTSDQPMVQHEMVYLKMGPGPNFILYRPYHLCSLETAVSIARAVIYNEPTIIAGEKMVADCVTVAKKDLKPGDVIDGLGGYTIYGTAVTAEESFRRNALPLGCAVPGAKVIRPVAKGEIMTYDDVELPEGLTIMRLRKEQDRLYAGKEVTLA